MGKGVPRKVLILGASGIVGQTMRLHVPPDALATYHRRTPSPYFVHCDFNNACDVGGFLTEQAPDVIVNLAGENRPDVVEREPNKHRWLNTYMPEVCAVWSDVHDCHFIQVSTQGVFDGKLAPYRANFINESNQPVNIYGQQKLRAEQLLYRNYQYITIVRLTFVLGIRPFPMLARENPMERWADPLLACTEVMDRWFSPCTAEDAATFLWKFALAAPPMRPMVYHIGYPVTLSRNSLALLVRQFFGGIATQPVSHDDFDGIAPRPQDTTFNSDALHGQGLFIECLVTMARAWKDRMDFMSLDDRTIELSVFFNQDMDVMRTQLQSGFAHFHQQVAHSFRSANPQNDDELLEWYRSTTAYIWELSAYHLDPGFNYMGMCDGIRTHLGTALLRTSDSGALHVLCLGDGIGDLSLFLNESPDFVGYYHDLAWSQTAEFAALRYFRRYGTAYENRFILSADWTPPIQSVLMDAVVALDFFEHLPNVEAWVRTVFAMLRPGGLFMAQNAFGIGDDEHEGSIPMHLTRNNKYVTEWELLLEATGFERASPGWWRRKS